ncbi:MAG: hypothetical protein WDO16_05925 [Bacteroidota bacterium]
MTLKDFDADYRNSIKASFERLKQSYNIIGKDYQFDLTNTEVSEAILERLKTYYETQNNIKTFLSKRYLTTGADYFVETILFFLNLFLKTAARNLEAHSERQIKQRRGAIRPDISIWDKDEVVAIIECKTQLGWNRHNWEDDYNNREVKLKTEFPAANSYMLVMTGSNWGGFNDTLHLGTKYFCLLKDIWPLNYTDKKQILTPIEKLFEQILLR